MNPTIDPTPAAPRKGHRRLVIASLAVIVGIVGIATISAAASSASKTDTWSGNFIERAAETITTTAPVQTPATAVPLPTVDRLPVTPVLPDRAAVNDVELTAFSPTGDFDRATASGLVTNHTSKASNYIITARFVAVNGGLQLGTATAFVNAVAPGATAFWYADFGPQVHPDIDITAEVATVTRMAT